MLDIILKFLSVLGIVLLVLVLLLLAVLLLVLFFPVTYRIHGRKTAQKAELSAGLNWLFGLLRVRASYPEPGTLVVKLLCFKLYQMKLPPDGKQDKKSDAESKQDTKETISGETAGGQEQAAPGREEIRSEGTSGQDKTQSESAAEQDKPESERTTGQDKTQSESASGRDKTLAENVSGQDKPQSEGATGQGKSQPESATGQDKTQSESAAGRDKTLAENVSGQDKPQPERTIERDKSRSESVAEQEETRSESASEKDESQTKEVTGQEETQSESASEQGKSPSEEASGQDENGTEEPRGGFFEKIKKIKYTIYNIYDKIKEIWKNISYYTALLQEDNTRQLWTYAYQRAAKVLKNIRPRHIKADILFGTGSPDTTGYAYGMYCMLSPVLGARVLVTPDFERAVLEGRLDISGHITIFVLVVNVVRLVIDKKFQTFIRKLKNEAPHRKKES